MTSRKAVTRTVPRTKIRSTKDTPFRPGATDFDYQNEESDVDIATDGAWVRARVWVPKEWLDLD